MARCKNKEQVCHSKKCVRSGKYAGVCYACCARLGAGNRNKGITKRRAALKGMGMKMNPERKTVSNASTGFEAHREKLLEMIQNNEETCAFDRYASMIVEKALRDRTQDLQRMTVVEGPCEPDSSIAQANADLMGASLRIVEPTEEHPELKRPPPLVCGSVAQWPLDVLRLEGRQRLARYMGKVEPVPSTDAVHFHASPVCTGSTSVNRFLNKRCRKKVKRYHAKCRKGVAGMRLVIKAFRRKRCFRRSGHSRSVSAEQPVGVSLRNRYNNTQHPALVGNHGCIKTTVNSCMVGMKVKGSPCCKRWVFQTDNPSLAGMLSQLQCKGQHPTIRYFGKGNLGSTGTYPGAFGKLFVLALMLRWDSDREWVVSD